MSKRTEDRQEYRHIGKVLDLRRGSITYAPPSAGRVWRFFHGVRENATHFTLQTDDGIVTIDYPQRFPPEEEDLIRGHRINYYRAFIGRDTSGYRGEWAYIFEILDGPGRGRREARRISI